MRRTAATPRTPVASVRATLRSRVGLFLAGLLLLAACASGSDSAGSTATQTSSETQESSAAEDDTPAGDPADSTEDDTTESSSPGSSSEESSSDEIFVSPLTEALGIAQDEIAAGFDMYVRDAEELVRSCMADAGFDYTPVTIGFNQQSRQAELQSSLSPEQFTAEYGFGISTLFELNFKDQGVIDFVNQRFGPPPTSERSPGEEDAFQMALNGVSTQGLTAEEAQAQLFDDAAGTGALEGSCRDYGYSTAENPGAVYDGLFSLLGDEFDALGDKFDNDPRIRQGWAEWQNCMATNGHSYENRFEIFDELFDRSTTLGDQYLSSQQVLTALGELQAGGFLAMDGDARAAFLEEVGALQGFSWVPEVQAAHDELVAFELLVAADSQDCLDEDLFAQVQFELETEFVETHGDQLALIAAGES